MSTDNDIQLTKNEQKVMAYLKGMDTFVSPTEIARGVGGKSASGLPRHSAWSSPICKRLVEKGLLERSNDGWYRPI